MSEQLITEAWLKSVGFKWHQLDRQPSKCWLLWLGDAVRENGGDNSFCSYEDIGIEVATLGLRDDDRWFCWLRSDCAGLYHRFIHLRHIRTQEELIAICEAISGQKWDPENNDGGSMRGPKGAAHMRKVRSRLDHQMMTEGYPWSPVEADAKSGRGGALPEHRVGYEFPEKRG